MRSTTYTASVWTWKPERTGGALCGKEFAEVSRIRSSRDGSTIGSKIKPGYLGYFARRQPFLLVCNKPSKRSLKVETI